MKPLFGRRVARMALHSRFQIDDLLSHLTEYWKPLALRQTYPLTLNPARPSLLRAEAQQNWDALPEAEAVYEDEAIEAFQDCHDLSRCFAGYYDLAPLWLIRSGEQMLIDTVDQLDRVPYAAALDALSAAGDWIAARLAKTKNERWEELLRAWRDRNAGDGLSLLKWSTSLDEQTLERLVTDGLLCRRQAWSRPRTTMMNCAWRRAWRAPCRPSRCVACSPVCRSFQNKKRCNSTSWSSRYEPISMRLFRGAAL